MKGVKGVKGVSGAIGGIGETEGLFSEGRGSGYDFIWHGCRRKGVIGNMVAGGVRRQGLRGM